MENNFLAYLSIKYQNKSGLKGLTSRVIYKLSKGLFPAGAR